MKFSLSDPGKHKATLAYSYAASSLVPTMINVCPICRFSLSVAASVVDIPFPRVARALVRWAPYGRLVCEEVVIMSSSNLSVDGSK